MVFFYNFYFTVLSLNNTKVYYGVITDSYLENYSYGTVFKQTDVQVQISIKGYEGYFRIKSEFADNIREIDRVVSQSRWAKIWLYEGKTYNGQNIIYQVETDKGIVLPQNNVRSYYTVLCSITFVGLLVPLLLIFGLYYEWIR